MRIFALFLSFLVLGVGISWAERTHVVQKNETLGGIAIRYNVSAKAIQALNGIKNPNLLFVGKKLKIPDGSPAEVTYVVKKGDSLGAIAARYGAKASVISARNQLASANLIKVGQKLVIPLVNAGSYKPPLHFSTQRPSRLWPAFARRPGNGRKSSSTTPPQTWTTP